MHPFHYLCPDSIETALLALEARPGAAVMSGGQSLVLAMRRGARRPDCIVDISRLPGLSNIACGQASLRIGALSTHHAVATSPTVVAALAGLARMAGSIADPAVRRKGTIGGALVQNDPSGDYPAALLALGATIETTDGVRQADAMCGAAAASAGRRIVTGISIAIPQTFAYAKFRVPSSGNALVGVAVAKHGEAVRIAVAGASVRGAFRWGEAEDRLSSRFHVDALADLSMSPAGLIDDLHGSASYRAHLAQVMLKRAMAAGFDHGGCRVDRPNATQEAQGPRNPRSDTGPCAGGRDRGSSL